MKRKIDTIIIHCSGTKAWQDFTAADIDRWHRNRGFDSIGYHYIIRLNGKIEKGRDVSLPGAHCVGWNEHSIGICYIGGLNTTGEPTDTRTKAQKRVMYELIQELQREYKIIQVMGHRDTSPDLNGNGVIEPFEFVKSCPCFDVKEFLRTGREMLYICLVILIFPFLFSSCKSSREAVTTHNRVEVDSSSIISYEGNSMNRSQISEKSLELMEEHVEQTVYKFRKDTVGNMELCSIVKTVADREVHKETNALSNIRTENSDSLKLSEHLLKYVDQEKENLTQKSDRKVSKVLIGVIFLVICGGIILCVLYKKRT